MRTVLHNKQDCVFLKSYDGVTGEVFFTPDLEEAKTYQNDWFAEAEQQYLRYHFKDDYPQVLGLQVDWDYSDDAEKEDALWDDEEDDEWIIEEAE